MKKQKLIVDFFIKEKNEQFSQIILEELEKFFSERKIAPIPVSKMNKNSEDKENNNYDESTNDSFILEDNLFFLNFDNKINTIEYLNKNEILHPLNKTLDESIYFLYLIEIFYIMKFNNSKSDAFRKINKLINTKFNPDYKKEKDEEEDEDEEGENDYNNIYNNLFDDISNINYKINLKNLNKISQILKELSENIKNNDLINKNFVNKFKTIYYQLQSYLNYLTGNYKESIYHINDAKLIPIKNIRTNEQKIFGYNSQGIINLKLKKYSLSKH